MPGVTPPPRGGGLAKILIPNGLMGGGL
jgi:hypothetical protein